MTKHLINKPDDAVQESLEGLVYFCAGAVELDADNKLIYQRKLSSDKVHIICGGGSGHEPSHAAMVGKGLLSIAVCGPPFASPTSRQITSALQKTIGTKGAILIVKQYTGDVLHFGLAKERFAATHPDDAKNVRMLIVGDDVAVGKTAGAMVGRRGLAGTCLVYKVAGALADQGASIEDLYKNASFVATNTATIGVSLEHCHIPGSKPAKASLKDDEVEIGMGIHNEPGNRTANLSPAGRLVPDLMHQLTSTSDPDRSYVPFKLDGSDEVILLVNNLGALPELELGIVLREAAKWLQESHFTVVRALLGQFMTSFAMPGVSISLLRLPRREEQSVDRDVIVDAIDAKTDASGWKWAPGKPPQPSIFKKPEEKDEKKPPNRESNEARGPGPFNKKVFEEAIVAACKSVIAAEPEITEYDKKLGDGDCGESLKAGAEGVLQGLDELDIRIENLSRAFVSISAILEEKMAGTSGALYSIFFSALASNFAQQPGEKADNEQWAGALEHALNRLYEYTLARPPSRTLVDPLASFVSTLVYDPQEGLTKAFDAAFEAAEATQFLDAKVGRSAYIDKDKVKESGVPEYLSRVCQPSIMTQTLLSAGAWAVQKLLEGIKSAIIRPK